MSARRLNIGIRSGAERLKALREAMRRVARGDRARRRSRAYLDEIHVTIDFRQSGLSINNSCKHRL